MSRQITHKKIAARLLLRITMSFGLSTLISCVGAISDSSNSSLGSFHVGNVKLALTDAPNDELQSIFVNVKHAELRLARGGKEARLIVAKGLGKIDLLKLQDGVTLPLAEMALPAGVEVTQIRLVLEENGNYLEDVAEQTCVLQTPSAQRTGIKILIRGSLLIEGGYDYSLVADFDAKKSIVMTGDGGCLLKPVFKLKSAAKIMLSSSDGEAGNEMPVSGDNSADTSGFDTDPTTGTDDGANTDSGLDIGTDTGTEIIIDPATLPPVIPPDQLSEYYPPISNQ